MASILTFLFSTALSHADDPSVSFSKDVAPILLNRCQGCHGPEKAKGGYRVDSYERLLKPGSSDEPALTAGNVEHSEIYRLLVTTDEDDRMPKKGDPLPAAEIATIKRWIEQGAKFDGKDRSASLASLSQVQHPNPPRVYPRPVPIAALAFSPAGQWIAASGYHEVTIWDAATGKLSSRFTNLPQRIASIDYSPAGTWLAVAGGYPGTSGEVRLLDVNDTTKARVLDRIGDMMLVARFSPDGSRLAVGGADNLIRIYDVESGKRTALIEEHADWVLGLAFSPDGQWLASASRDKSARVFNAKSGEMRTAFLDHSEAVYDVAWSPDGKRCLSVGRDRRLRTWDAAEGKNLDDAKKGPKTPELPADAFAIRILKTHAYVACADGIVRPYHIDTREPGPALDKLNDWALSITIREDDGRIAAGSHAGEVQVWAEGKAPIAFDAVPR